MIWTQSVNPRVWNSGRYQALAEDNPNEEGGYVAQIYENAYRGSVIRLLGTAQWGGTIGAALRQCVRTFDKNAQMPEEDIITLTCAGCRGQFRRYQWQIDIDVEEKGAYYKPYCPSCLG